MAQMHTLEEQVEVQCSAHKLFEVVLSKQTNIPNICSHKVSKLHTHHADWTSVGTTRKWDCVIDGEAYSLTEKIVEVDEKNMTVVRKVIEADILKHYTSLTNKIQVIPKGHNCCVLKYSLHYEKVHQSAPEPNTLVGWAIGLFKDIGRHLANN